MTMKRIFLAVGLAIVTAILVTGFVRAQGAPQTTSIKRVDIQKLSAGYRSSKIVGSPVVNDTNEKIGEIDDLLVQPGN